MHCLWTTIEHWIETVAVLHVDIEHARETLAEIEDTTWGVTLREIDGERVRGGLPKTITSSPGSGRAPTSRAQSSGGRAKGCCRDGSAAKSSTGSASLRTAGTK